MKLRKLNTQKDRKQFYKFAKEVYRYQRNHRATEDEITSLLVEGKSGFHSHANVHTYLMINEGKPCGRFAFIHDQKLQDFVQVSFFEALPGLSGVLNLIKSEAKKLFPRQKKLLIGLNGHLNYGAGFLMNRFDKAPVFGLPYNHSYYHNYFEACLEKSMFSFRFPLEPFYGYQSKMAGKDNFEDIKIRKLNKRELKRDVELYTYLNNACFKDHPYWSDRSVEEDYELFHPFRFLIREENLLFAEVNGKAVGFLLWYPDFNQLVSNNTSLGVISLLKYRLFNPIDTFRLTEIAVLPEYRKSKVTQALILSTISFLKKGGYKYGEGGFIFEENIQSMAMTRRFLQRAVGSELEAYRKFAVYECEL